MVQKSKITHRERFLKVFDGEIPDRVPTFVQGVLTGFISKYEDEIFENYEGELTYNPNFDAPAILGFDSVFAHLPGAISPSVEIQTKDGKKISVGMSGQLSREDTKGYYAGGVLDTLEKHEKVFENISYNKSEIYQQQLDYYKSIEHIIFPVPCLGGIFDTIWQSMGFSKFALEFRRKTTFIKTVIKDYAEVLRNVMQRVVDAIGDKLGIINILDDIAYKGRSMIRPEEWWEYFGVEYQKVTKIAKDAGLHVMMHSDGDVTEMVPYLQKAGFEGLQGWEGGADPRKVKELYPDFVIIGFGDIGSIIPFGTPDEVKVHVTELYEVLKPGGNFIFGPSTVITPENNITNITIMMETTKELGEY